MVNTKVKKQKPVTRQAVENALAKCNDPELGIDIVSLGLIYDIAVPGKKVVITMTLTTPGCPLVPYFRQTIVDKVQQATGVADVEIILTFDPPWSPAKMSPAAKAQLTMVRG